MSKARRTFQSALWNHAGKILEYVLLYGTSIVIARGLGVEENGRFVGLFSLSQLLLALCSFGLETSLNKFIPQLKEERQNTAAAFILRRAILIRVFAFFAVAGVFYLLVHIVTFPLITGSGEVLLLVLIFTGARSIVPLFIIVLTAQLQTALTARINLIIRVIELSGVVLLPKTLFTVENLFLFFLATSGIHIFAYASLSRLNLFGETAPVEMRPIVTFGAIYWLNTIVDFFLGRQGDVFFLTNLLHDSTDGSLYDVAYSVAQLASMGLTVGLAGVTFATFARLAVSDPKTMDRFYSFSIRMISFLTIPLYTFIFFQSGAILTVLYSSRYFAAVTLVQGIVTFRVASRLFGGPENAEYLLSKGRVGTLVLIGVAAAVVNTVLNLILIPKMGATGAVIAGGCAILLVNALGALAVFRISPTNFQFAYWAKLVLAGVSASFLVSLLDFGSSLGAVVLSGLIYCCLLAVILLAFKPFAREDVEWFDRMDERLSKMLRKFSAVQPQFETPVS